MNKDNDTSSIIMRPPIVTVMGHIDHGKTSLLDKIRQSQVAGGEVGGITQKIGAYQVEIETKEKKKEKITFIDTPGHAAFAQMRARGAQITDIVVLIVAADEGVKPQTEESLSHIKNSGIPYIVAINKIDLPNASVDNVKGQLAQAEAVPEDYGGDVPVVGVSAKTGEGIEELLELILLMGQINEYKADPNGELEAVVIESRVDPKRGALATLIVKNGKLFEKDTVYTNDQEAKIKSLYNDLGKQIESAYPSDPVEVLGFKKPPAAGSLVKGKPFTSKVEPKEAQVEEDPFKDFMTSSEEEAKLPVIIKADVNGSLEAIISNLPKEAQVIHSGIGEITDSDVFLAKSSRAKIYGFNSTLSSEARQAAKEAGVEIETYNIIYDLFDDVDKSILKIAEPNIDQEILGKAEIIREFPFNQKRVAGCKITEGRLNKRVKVHLIRDGKDLGSARITSLRRDKQDTQEIAAGNECGLIISPQLDFKPGDMLISYKSE